MIFCNTHTHHETMKRYSPYSDTNVSTKHAKVHHVIINRRDVEHEGHFIACLPDTLLSIISEFIGNESVCTNLENLLEHLV